MVDPIKNHSHFAACHHETVTAADQLTSCLESTDPIPSLRAAISSGWADEFLPELPALQLEQDPVHRHKDVLEHTLVVTANVAPEIRLRLAALFHDIAKPATRRIDNGRVSFHHHEALGARVTSRRLSALGYPATLTADVSRLVELSGRFHGYSPDWTDSAVRRYARDAGHLLGDLNHLVRCDCTTRRPGRVVALQRKVDDLEHRIQALAAADRAASIRPPLDGARVMQVLGIGPGRHVGEALAMLSDLQTIQGDVDDNHAEAALRTWWATRSAPPSPASQASPD